MLPNDKIICPACKEESMAKLKNKMDGFTTVGKVLVCMLCGAELEEYKASETAAGGNEKKLEQLGMLLGAAPSATVRLAAADEEKRFCKDCKHFLKHPFVDRCEIDNKPVDPMDDCEKFEKRPQK